MPHCRQIVALAAGMIALAGPAPAFAGELFGGVYKHSVDTPLTLEGGREHGADFQLGYRGSSLLPGLRLQPYVFAALNSAGDTSYAAAGLSLKLGDRIFVRPGLGLAVHTGSTSHYDLPDRVAYGSRILFEPELGIGARVAPRVTVEASWVHMSHATLFSEQNPGIDNIGARLSLGL